MSSRRVGAVLADATSEEAQLILSLLVWPKECPDPRVVDEWLRPHARDPVRGAAATIVAMANTSRGTWVPFMRSNGPAWTALDVDAMIGDVREIDWLGTLGYDGTGRSRVLEGAG
jgi:hypothetical protein